MSSSSSWRYSLSASITPARNGAERHRQPDFLHQHRGAEHEQQREADEHLALPRLGDDAQHRPHQEPAGGDEQRDHAERLAGGEPREILGAVAGEQGEDDQQRHHREVLEEQHGERCLAARRAEQVLLFEDGEADRGRGHRDAHARHDADRQRQLEQHGNCRDRGDRRQPPAPRRGRRSSGAAPRRAAR
jgi:hypothetical protein